MKRLIEIQQELKAPKNQRNSFGGYNFRSCEDILEAVKPLLAKHNLALIINDEVTSIDGGFELKEQTEKKAKHLITSNRVYIKATATLYDEEGKIVAQTSALAREEETKTGMDASQLTGATSSYARKYALNGLFAIDDNKDSDSTNTHNKNFPKNNDIDIIEGLKACENIKNLETYKAQYQDKVTDLNIFKKAYFQKLAELNKGKVNG
jgi:hypothetical protein